MDLVKGIVNFEMNKGCIFTSYKPLHCHGFLRTVPILDIMKFGHLFFAIVQVCKMKGVVIPRYFIECLKPCIEFKIWKIVS